MWVGDLEIFVNHDNAAILGIIGRFCDDPNRIFHIMIKSGRETEKMSPEKRLKIDKMWKNHLDEQKMLSEN